MKTKDASKEVVKSWMGPEEIVYMPSQMSIRLPVLVAAKVSALCEIFPKKSKSEIVGDILTVGLAQIEEELPGEYNVLSLNQTRDKCLMRMSGIKLKYHEAVKAFIEKLKEETDLNVPSYHFSKTFEEDCDPHDWETNF